MQTISVDELKRIGVHRVDLIDVRTPAEFRSVHVRGARNVPLETLEPHAVMAAREASTSEAVYVLCKSGARAAKACEKLTAAGYPNVVRIEGGTDACSSAGVDVIRGKGAISLERQVRIVAGLIVLVASLLGIFVHPYFAGVSAFVGAGLTFAGVTDTCGMAMVLAKMPWNQVRDGEHCTA